MSSNILKKQNRAHKEKRLFCWELLWYTRKLRCTGTPTSKIFKLTIIFME